MQVLSVNLGTAGDIAAKSGQSGIFKAAVPSAVVGATGLEGDAIIDRRHHGGTDQAVYAYTQNDYDWWGATLGRDLVPGVFGENLTLDRWPANIICVGDRLAIGKVVIEVTSPRIPCVTLETRMGVTGFAKTFLKAQRPGPYFRVIEGGRIEPGQSVEVRPFQGLRKRLLDWPGLFAPPLTTRAEIEAWLSIPVHHKMKAQFEAKL